MYCPVCLRKNPRHTPRCTDCGAAFSEGLQREMAAQTRRDWLRWGVVFALICVPFLLSFGELSRTRPLFSQDFLVLLTLPVVCFLLMVCPRWVCNLMPLDQSNDTDEARSYRSGTRGNIMFAARQTGLFLFAVHAISLIVQALRATH